MMMMTMTNTLQRSVLPLLLLLDASEGFQTHSIVGFNRGELSSPRYPLPSILGHPNSRTTSTVLVLSSSLDGEELPKFSSDIVPTDDGSSSSNAGKSTSSSTSTTGNGNNQGLLKRLNDYGQSLKPKAKEVELKAQQASKMTRKFLLKAKACLYWTLYMAYRGYRGFFVILPAVFREVYGKMEMAVDYRVLDDDDDDDESNLPPTTTSSLTPTGPPDVNPSTGKVRLRTRITVSVLAGFVTFTYVVGGLVRVLMKFGKTILSTSSLSKSFTMAAEEVEGNEDRLMRLSGGSSKKKEDGDINGGKGTSNSNDKDVGS